MDRRKERIADIFSELGFMLKDFGHTRETEHVLSEAVSENPWFTENDIMRSVKAIREQMLAKDYLLAWLDTYDLREEPKNIGVIMAGNIPLVGFFDMLCVLASGCRCFVKPSSKDKVLVKYVISLLKRIDPSISVYEMGENTGLDAVIATGSDNTNRYFVSKYGHLPSIFRGSRSSVALVTGNETREEFEALAEDIFSYSGLGCRNVSHLLFLNTADIDRVNNALQTYKAINPKYINNYRQRKALLSMQGISFTDGGFFILREDDGFPNAVSEVTYQCLSDLNHVADWLSANANGLQCVVASQIGYVPAGISAAGFGRSQFPTLFDYPDGKDVMRFLSGLD